MLEISRIRCPLNTAYPLLVNPVKSHSSLAFLYFFLRLQVSIIRRHKYISGERKGDKWTLFTMLTQHCMHISRQHLFHISVADKNVQFYEHANMRYIKRKNRCSRLRHKKCFVLASFILVFYKHLNFVWWHQKIYFSNKK